MDRNRFQRSRRAYVALGRRVHAPPSSRSSTVGDLDVEQEDPRAAQLFAAWGEQEKKLSDDLRLQQEYRSAKEQAKLLKRQMKEKQKERYSEDITFDFKLKLPQAWSALKKMPHPARFLPKARQVLLSIKIQSRKLLLQFLRLRRMYQAGAIGVFLLVIASGVFMVGQSDQGKGAVGDNGESQGQALGLKTEKPVFDTVLPAGKNEEEVGGLRRLSPDGVDPVYVFVDKIGEVPVRISQQKLPEKFKIDRDGELRKIAEQYYAKETIDIGGETAYIGTSAKGPQSVFFVKDDLLIFITSDTQIDKNAWQSYLLLLT